MAVIGGGNWRLDSSHEGGSHRTRTPFFVTLIIVAVVIVALFAAYWGKSP